MAFDPFPVRTGVVVAALTVIASMATLLRAQVPASCMATATSMTPAGWSAPVAHRRVGGATPARAAPPLVLVADVPLPGPAKRFDYQSFDSTTGRLYISHMYGNRLDVFDTRAGTLIASKEGFPGATGVWAVPEQHRVYVSVTGRHAVAVVDDRSLAAVAWIGGVSFPDGIAYASANQKVFVSDERGARILSSTRTRTPRPV